MKYKFGLFFVFPCFFTSCVVHATTADSGQGRIYMQGAIIDTACAIAIESRDQVIYMDTVPLIDIRRNGQGASKPFSIDLVNCVIKRSTKDLWKQFQVTFDGTTDGEFFGVSGDASGIGLQITDQDGHTVVPGVPLPPADIIPGEMQLNYYLKLVANKKPLKVGDYSSSIRFRLDYF
ncbi:fimbrial protein [Enterobacter cloacae]|uniref:fimbrial protein n=1 Tax=Enterobacter cloacae TaxID=550 RepID=UPI0020CBCB63|nr:fimbrial protein [Enterobacter cloacae]